MCLTLICKIVITKKTVRHQNLRQARDELQRGYICEREYIINDSSDHSETLTDSHLNKV